MCAEFVPPPKPELPKQDNWDRIGNKIGDGIMSAFMVMKRPFRPLQPIGRAVMIPLASLGSGFRSLGVVCLLVVLRCDLFRIGE